MFTMSGVDIYEIRRANLVALLERSRTTLAEFARQTGVSPIYLTQVLSEKTQRHMGDRVARRIEDRRELPSGWMDSITTPAHALTNRAVVLGQKFDSLPDSVKDRIESEIETLFRYSRAS